MIHVALASDEAYLPHCAAAVYSVLATNDDVSVHVLWSETISAENRGIFQSFVESSGGKLCIHIIPDEWIEGLPRLRRISEVMWYRIFLPDLLHDLDRILYLDCDTIVRHKLSELWNTDLENAYIGAVANVMEIPAEAWPDELGVGSSVYFNSGVMLMNLAAMRRDGISKKIIEFGRKEYKHLRWPDQDALNVYLGPGRRELHPKWNCQNSFFYYSWSRKYFDSTEFEVATADPAILHFEGGEIVKPWHYLSKHPFRYAYLEHRQKTPWPIVEYEGRSLESIFLRFLPVQAIFELLKIKSRIGKKLRSLWFG